jgi:muramoyltetrapeptide carboxypeptidase
MLEGRGPKKIFLEGGEAGPGATAGGSPSRCILVPGACAGTLVGGCLSLLAASVGAPWEFDCSGALLFFEDVAEEAYRIDRMLGTLIDSGRFAKLSGILIGSLSAVTFGGVEDGARLRAVLRARLAPLGIPVALGLPAGHRGPNVTLPVGARTAWDGKGTLTLLEEITS